MNSKKEILIVDINTIPHEYKKETVDETRLNLEAIYDVPIFITDMSKSNLAGAQLTQKSTYYA